MGKIKREVGQEVEIKINNITDKAIFGEILENKLSGMLHYKNFLFRKFRRSKKFKKNDKLKVKILEIKDDKIKFSKRALDKIL